MKKLLFLIALMYTCIGLKSQDIFTSGCFINENGSQVAAIFKNGGVMLRYEQQDRDLCSSAMAIDTVNNDIYWSVNSNPVNSISDGYGYVMKNEEIVLDNVLGTCINDISLDGGDMYSAGYMNDIYDATAAVWKNGDTTPLYTYCDDKHSSEVLGIDVVDGVVYACGYYEEGLNYGCVWVNGDLYASYPYSKVTNIAYYKGDIFYVVNECYSTVYKSGAALFDLYNGDNSCNDVNGMTLAHDYVYCVGFMGFNDCCVWKNADLFYLHPFARDADFNACYYYDQSIYYVGYDHEDQGIIFKDGEQLCSLDFYYFYDVWVRPSPLAIAEIETDENSAVLIYNIFGELVKTVFSDNNFINISDLPSGFYIAKKGNHVVKFMK